MAGRFQSVIQDFQQEKQDYYSKLLQHPAFYTIQDHAETKQKQLQSWADITHSYFKSRIIMSSSLTELCQENYPFFCLQNFGLPKRLKREEIKMILETLVAQQSVLWENENYDGFQVQKYSANELADDIYQWQELKQIIKYNLKVHSMFYTSKLEKYISKQKQKYFKQMKGKIYQLFSIIQGKEKLSNWRNKHTGIYSIGNQTKPTDKFYELPDNQILSALEILQENRKGVIFEDNNSYSFKFQ